MKNWDGVFIVGLAFLLLWISHVPYLFTIPLKSTPGIQKIAEDASEVPDWIKDEAGFGGKSRDDIEDGLVTEFRVSFAKSITLCMLGILSGLLILRRNNYGRFIAIGLSGCFLSLKLYAIISYEEPFQGLYATYALFFSKYPFRVIHLEILTNIILLIVFVYLLKPSVGRSFIGTRHLKT